MSTQIASTRLSSKGQIVLPKAICDSQAWGPGTEFTVEVTGHGILLRTVSQFAESDLDQVAGCLQSKGKPKTLAEMDSAIQSELMRRHHGNPY